MLYTHQGAYLDVHMKGALKNYICHQPVAFLLVNDAEQTTRNNNNGVV